MEAYKRLMIVVLSCSLIVSVIRFFKGNLSYYVANVVALIMIPVLGVVYKYYWNNAAMLNVLRAGFLLCAGYLAILLFSLLSDTREENYRQSVKYDDEPDLRGCEYEDLKIEVSEEDKRFFCNKYEVEKEEVEKAFVRSLREAFQSSRE